MREKPKKVGGPTGKKGPQAADESVTTRCGDRAFKAAMLAAIKSGTENPVVGVVKAKPATRYIPSPRGEVESGYRSSAGYMAD